MSMLAAIDLNSAPCTAVCLMELVNSRVHVPQGGTNRQGTQWIPDVTFQELCIAPYQEVHDKQHLLAASPG